MKMHGNAQLTVAQRKLIHELYHSGQAKKSELARRFAVNRKTIDRWVNRDSPYDQPSGAKEPRRVITEPYREAVIAYRNTNPKHGPVTIAHFLKERFDFANRGTVLRILQAEGLTRKRTGKKSRGKD